VGVRISKSFKVAPGVRVRLNTKSTSVSFGGKGMRYTVNSKGRRTTTVKVPGTPLSAQQVSGTHRSSPRQNVSPPQQHVVAAQAAPKPGRGAPKGEKRLYKILAANLDPPRWAARCEQVAEKFPDQRIAAATLAGLFSLTENPPVAIRTLGFVADSGVEVADDPFLRRYAPVKAWAMDAGGGRQQFVPLSRDLVLIRLATVHLVVGHLDQAEAIATELKDTPVAHELRRKIAAARGHHAGQTGTDQAVASERAKQVELLERVYSGIADLTQSRDRVQAQITALEQQHAKLEQQIGKARQFGREDLAQQALTLLNSGQSQIAALRSQLDQLLTERAKLTAMAQALQAKIDGAGGATAR
jgi:Protein of unknown function (DUF4236)